MDLPPDPHARTVRKPILLEGRLVPRPASARLLSGLSGAVLPWQGLCPRPSVGHGAEGTRGPVGGAAGRRAGRQVATRATPSSSSAMSPPLYIASAPV